MNKDTELKPCPFCGSDAGLGILHVYCLNKECGLSEINYVKPDEWNHRSNADSARLDWLEESFGLAIFHDDDEHWYVSGDGMQDVVVDGPKPFVSTFIIDDDSVALARKTVREAIDAAMQESSDG